MIEIGLQFPPFILCLSLLLLGFLSVYLYISFLAQNVRNILIDYLALRFYSGIHEQTLGRIQNVL